MEVDVTKFQNHNETGEKYKICLWGIDSPYCFEHVKEFSGEFNVFSVVLGRVFGFNFDIQIINPFKKESLLFTIFRILNVARVMYLFLKYDRKCDCHLLHYLTLPYALAIALLPLKKPIAYFVYGADVIDPEGFQKKLVKKALKRVDVIFCLTRSFYTKYIVNKYGIDEKKIVPIWWSPINPSFKRFDDKTIENLRKKWNLTKDYVIFSPRATLEFYNHHLLIDGVALLDKDLKEKVQIVITGFGDSGYRRRLVEQGKKEGIEVVDLRRILTPEEMAEIYNISIITSNISNGDDLGRSTFEAIMCGSILLLNKNSRPYQEIYRDGKYCKMVELKREDIARSIEFILYNTDALKDEEERLRIINIVNWDRNKSKIIECIKKMIEEIKR